MSETQFTIREAKEDDAEAISEVIRMSWSKAYEGIEPQEALDEIRNDDEAIPLDYLKDSIEQDSTLFIVAEVDAEIEGEMIIELAGEEDKIDYQSGEVFLKSAYVKPEMQGEGIGTLILEKAIQKLPSKIVALKTMVLKENSEAQGFYKSKGFEKVAEGIIGGGEGSMMEKKHTTLIMRKEI